jgi:hypothetical protein
MALQLFKIATTSLDTATSSITFSNIPQGYTDLCLLLSLRSSSASGDSNCFVYFNGVTGTSYQTRRLLGSGSAASSDTFSSYPWVQVADKIPNSTFTASTFANVLMYIPNYTSTNNKSISVD